jgi:hypothetical protein
MPPLLETEILKRYEKISMNFDSFREVRIIRLLLYPCFMVNIVRSFIWLGNPQVWGVGGGLKQIMTTKGKKESLVVYSQNFARLSFSNSFPSSYTNRSRKPTTMALRLHTRPCSIHAAIARNRDFEKI